ncbi:hypothetical protein Ndes2437B_g08472 [Nannochloris sp. 'desiccata']
MVVDRYLSTLISLLMLLSPTLQASKQDTKKTMPPAAGPKKGECSPAAACAKPAAPKGKASPAANPVGKHASKPAKK